MPLFRRSEAAQAVEPEPQGKRTPKQSEQIAKNRRPLVPADRTQARREAREKLTAEREKQREGFARGDERYLPPRDKGPVRRFVRDWVDARFSIGMLMMPAMVVVLFLTFVNTAELRLIATVTMWSFVLLTVLDCLLLAWMLRRALRKKFGDADAKGHGWYASMRAIQMPFMRMPKPRVKLFGSVE